MVTAWALGCSDCVTEKCFYSNLILTVVDGDSGAPLPEATVLLNGTAPIPDPGAPPPCQGATCRHELSTGDAEVLVTLADYQPVTF